MIGEITVYLYSHGNGQVHPDDVQVKGNKLMSYVME